MLISLNTHEKRSSTPNAELNNSTQSTSKQSAFANIYYDILQYLRKKELVNRLSEVDAEWEIF